MKQLNNSALVCWIYGYLDIKMDFDSKNCLPGECYDSHVYVNTQVENKFCFV